SAFTRLIDMGLEPFLVASGLRGVLAQRLVRKRCPNCAGPAEPPPEDIAKEFAGAAPAELRDMPGWRRPVGCRDCHGTGYKGRLAIYEMIELIAPLREAVVHRLPAHAAVAIAREAGFRSMRQDGLLKAAAGITSVDEVVRVTGLDVAD